MKQIDVDKLVEIFDTEYYVLHNDDIIQCNVQRIEFPDNDTIGVFVKVYEDNFQHIMSYKFNLSDLSETPELAKEKWLISQLAKEAQIDEDIIKIKGE